LARKAPKRQFPRLRKVKQGFAEKVFLLIPPEESFRSKRQSKIPYLTLSFFVAFSEGRDLCKKV